MRTPGYRADVRAARRRLHELQPWIAPTPTGAVQYATEGAGPDVLVVHGIMGGFDAGLRLARGLLPGGYRVIAPSRFGYLGTPMPAAPSVAAQADAHAALLDVLGVRRVAVLAASAGGASALQLAIRHPQRVDALILVSSVAPGPYRPALPRPVARALWESDVLMWGICRFLPGTITGLMGVPKDLPLTPEDRAVVAEELRSLLPSSQRVRGALFDQFVSNADVNNDYPFDRITAPTLLIHAKDQPGYQGIPGGDGAAAAMADLIPSARLLSIDHGGHLLLGDHPEIEAEVRRLLTGIEGWRVEGHVEGQREPRPAAITRSGVAGPLPAEREGPDDPHR